MCGIAGFFDPEERDRERGARITRAMTDEIRHRGPDDEGLWSDPELPLFFGHRRLSIIDLSPEGHQPMVSPGGRFVVVFNGEIYNFRTLRAELEGRFPFRGHSDTEVLSAALEAYGVRGALERLVGMFALAIYDKQERVLHLARDRMGEKPLYFGRAGKTLFFASELKALCAHPAWVGRIRRESVLLFARFAYVPAPHSIYEDVFKLPAGQHLELQLDAQGFTGFAPEGRAYWSLADAVRQGQADPFPGDETAAVDELERLLMQSIEGQMIADVPLGAFLSGGIDSSTVVALMQRASARPVKTFTIGFHVPEYDEAAFAAEIARQLGTDHTELYLTPAETLATVPEMPRTFDEPFADPSQVPTYLVAKLARSRVTVSLSGDGGDELFGGYPRYFYAEALRRRLGALPYLLRRPAGGLLRAVPAGVYDRMIRAVDRLSLGRFGLPGRLSGEKLRKLADLLVQREPDLFLFMLSHWQEPEALVPGVREVRGLVTDRPAWLDELDFIARFMFLDTKTYLADDILVKVDRASMAHALESRVPLLDHRIVEFAWRLPAALRTRAGQGKWILREVLARHVPRELFERPKMGFAMPIDRWLRADLRDWAGDLLAPDRLRADGFFDAELLGRVWDEHQSGRRKRDFQLWDVLMFQAWLDAARVDRRAKV